MLQYAQKRAQPIVLFEFLAPSLIGQQGRRYLSDHRVRNSDAQPKSPDIRVGDYGSFPMWHPRPGPIFTKISEGIGQLPGSQDSGPSNLEVDIFNSSVVRLRQALKDGDVRAAWEKWNLLDEHGLLRYLGPPHFEGYARALAALCVTETEWSETEIAAIEEIALVSAAGSATEALSTRMVDLLTKGDAGRVLELYDRYLRLSDRNDKNGGTTAEDTNVEDLERVAMKDSTYLAWISDWDTVTLSSNRTSILLAAIGAHALLDDFSSALRTTIKAGIRIPNFATSNLLRKLKDEELKQKVERWVRDLEVGRLVSRPTSLSRQIMNLASDNGVFTLEKLYARVMHSISGPSPFIAPTPAAITSEKQILMPESGWASFISAFIRCRRPDLAEKVWDDLLSSGVSPGASLWTSLFDAYGQVGAFDEAETAWESMHSQGVSPDGPTYRAFISTLILGSRLREAIKQFETFDVDRATRSPPMTEAHVMHVYNAILNGLLVASKDKDAEAIMQRLLAAGLKPDLVTYNTFLACHARRGNLRTLSSTLNRMIADGIKGDVFTFSTVLSALLKVGRSDAIDMVFNIMKRQGIKPTVATYTSIIDYLMREGDEKNLKAAMELLRRMEQDRELKPNEVTYTSVLSGIYRGSWLNQRLADECAEYIWDCMNKRQFRPNRATYNIFIRACLQNPDPKGLERGLGLYREITQRRMGITNDTWHILLYGLIRRKEWGIANEVVADLEKFGDKPSPSLARLVEKIKMRV